MAGSKDDPDLHLLDNGDGVVGLDLLPGLLFEL